jgi:hypothetical protein
MHVGRTFGMPRVGDEPASRPPWAAADAALRSPPIGTEQASQDPPTVATRAGTTVDRGHAPTDAPAPDPVLWPTGPGHAPTDAPAPDPVLWPTGPLPAPTLSPAQTVHAQVTDTRAAACTPGEADLGRCVALVVRMSDGPLPAFVLPAILAGRDPLAVAVVGSCLIMFAVLYLTHGMSARTSTAVLGTLLSLALIGLLGAVFAAAAELTGSDDQTSNLIATLGTGVDARGLLLAGVIIGALGVLDDVTVTQTSAVWELHRADPRMSAPDLFRAAMRIGRDHVSSAVNTLVLAYAGASLPLLLLFTLSGRALGEVVTAQDVATEVVRTLVGSIGLVASVPITTRLRRWSRAGRSRTPSCGRPRPAVGLTLRGGSPGRSTVVRAPGQQGRLPVALPLRQHHAPGERRRQLARRRPPRPAGVPALGQHGHHQQPVDREPPRQHRIQPRVAEPLADDHVVRTGAPRRQPRIEVVLPPPHPVPDPGPRGQRGPGGQPDTGDVDRVHREPPGGQPHRDRTPAAGHVQGSPARGQQRLPAAQRARRHRGVRGDQRMPGVPALAVVPGHAVSPARRAGGRPPRPTAPTAAPPTPGP